jgi:hypothetical protein
MNTGGDYDERKTGGDYEDRKLFLERLPALVKDEYEEIFRIVKQSGIPWSENSNGVFFDINAVPIDIFLKLKSFMEFCMANRADQEARIRAMEALKTEAT